MEKPDITSTPHVLPFDKLSPEQFERLCLGLVLREGFLHVQHLGAGGSDEGWDVIGYLPTEDDLELWVFQCKRYQAVYPKVLIQEVDKCIGRGADEDGRSPARLVFVTSCTVSARTRKTVAEYASAKGLACEFWAETELNQRVNDHPGLVWQFFRRLPEIIPDLPFNVPFPPNHGFAGREQKLEDLHAALNPQDPGSTDQPAGGSGTWSPTRLVGLAGPAGIGKTQIAVEYAYRWRDAYPGGILWINAAEPLYEGFAAVGRAVQRGELDQPLQTLVRTAYDYLRMHRDALLILDNVADPAALRQPLGEYPVLAGLPCRMLFTTHQRHLHPFPVLQVEGLPEKDALQLLLRRPERQKVLEPSHTEHAIAKVVCDRLGRLPLALEIAGAFLGSSPKVTLADFDTRLRTEGALETVNEEGPALWPGDRPWVHDPRVKAAFDIQYANLNDETADLLFRVAGQLPKATLIPIVRLGLLAGVSDRRREGHESPLDRALSRLFECSLAEELREDHVRLHPLIHEFAARLTADKDRPAFCRDCVEHLVTAFEDMALLEEQCARRGIGELQEDLVAGRWLLSAAGGEERRLDRRLESLARLLAREGSALQAWDREAQPAVLAQQLHYRASSLDLPDWAARAGTRLQQFGTPWLSLRWRAARIPSALERSIAAHQKAVRAVVTLFPGRQAVSAGDDGLVRLWNLTTGLPAQDLGHFGRPVTALAAARDGGWVVAGDDAGRLWAWDLSAPGRDAPEGMLFGDLGTRVWSLAISADGKRVLSGGGDGRVTLWSLTGGADQVPHSQILGEHGRRVLAVALLDGGRCAASGAHDGTLKVWLETDPNRWQECSAERAGSAVRAIAAPLDGSWLAVGVEDGTIEIWQLTSTGDVQLAACLQADGSPVTALAVTSDGGRVTAASSDGSLRVWDLWDEPEPAARILAEGIGAVTSIAVTADGLHCVSGDTDGRLQVWNLEVDSTSDSAASAGHRGWVSALAAVGINGEMAASGGGDGLVKVWAVDSPVSGCGAACADLNASGPVSALTATAGGDWLVVGTQDGKIELRRTRQVQRPIRVLSYGVQDGEVEPGQTPDVSAQSPIDSFQAHGNAVTSLAMDRDGHILSVGNDGLVQVWRLFPNGEAGRLACTLGKISHGINALAIHPSAPFALVGVDDGAVLAWELGIQGGEVAESQPIEIGRHGARVRALAITADGKWAASGDESGTIHVWSVAALPSGMKLAGTLVGHRGPVYGLCAGQAAGELISGGADATLRVWVPRRARGTRTSSHVQGVVLSVEAPVWSVAALPGGAVIAGDKAGNVYCFDIVRLHNLASGRAGGGT